MLWKEKGGEKERKKEEELGKAVLKQKTELTVKGA